MAQARYCSSNICIWLILSNLIPKIFFPATRKEQTMFVLSFFLCLLALLALLAVVMIPVAIANQNRITLATTAGATPIIPWFFRWVVWAIILAIVLSLVCIIGVASAVGSVFGPQYGQLPDINGSQNDGYVENGGIPVQFGIFPVSGGFGVNAVIGESYDGGNFTFIADGKTITPYTVDCRDFSDNPFYGEPVVTRCDYLFRDPGYTYLSVETPLGFNVKEHGITLVPGANALSDTSWFLP